LGGKLEERGHVGDMDLDGRKRNLGRIWTVFIWLRIGTSGELF
jgi:hypothetical protein